MKHQLSLIAIAVVNIQLSHANAVPSPSNKIDAVYPGRITGQLLSGSEQQLGSFGDAMIPLLQNQNNNLFADATVMLGQEQRSTLSGGLGYRGIKQVGLEESILGAYLFADYYQTRLKNQYWQLNPGLEWLHQNYEVRLQGYIPLSNRTQTYRNTLATEIPGSVLKDSGRTNRLSGATGHQIIDTPVHLVEEFGPGLELEAGKFINYAKGMWFRVGGYHFNYKDTKSINGVEANIEAIINPHVSLLLQNNYDNQNKNRFAIGLRVNFGGASAPTNSLQKQMTSPIIRHIARQAYGEALPTRKSFQASGPSFNRFGNIWFFSPNGSYPAGAATTRANCTAENPCSTIDTPTAEEIAILTPNANLFFATGSYLIPTDSNSHWVNLQNGQSVFGRNTGWLSAATDINRPLINGGLVWGNSNGGVNPMLASGAIYDLRINNNNQAVPANIFSLYNSPLSGDSVLAAASTGSLTVINSEIQASNTTDNVNALGIAATGGGDVFVENSSANILNTGNASGGQNVAAFGVFANNNATVSGSSITANTTGAADGLGSAVSTDGIDTFKGDINLSNSTISASASGSATNGSFISVYSILASNNASVTASTLNAQTTGASDSSGAQATGAYANEISLINSTINTKTTGTASNGGDNTASGIAANNDATVIDSTINVQTTGATSNGSVAQAYGLLTFTGNANISGSIINSQTNGSASNGGDTTATGIFANTTIFQGDTASLISAISATGATPVSGSVSNNSTPQSLCSTDGINFSPCS